MTLSATMGAARSGLSVFSEQIGLVARNIGNASDPNAARKLARVMTASNGDVLFAGVDRAEDRALRDAMLEATSTASTERVKVDAAKALQETIGGPDGEGSPSALIGELGRSLQVLAAQPSQASAANTAIATARSLANALNEGASAIQDLRQRADDEIAQAVDSLNGMLGQLEALDQRIVTGTRAGRDITDDLDQRDKLLGQIAEKVGIRVVPKDMNSVAVYTDSGITLFDTKAREVTFNRTPIAPGQPGGTVSIDGVPATGSGGSMVVRSGQIVGLIAVRDGMGMAYEAQFDEIARGLVEAFSESDQTSSGAPDRPGLFTYAGATVTPATGTRVVGLAARIQVNATVDPAQGGSWTRLRDGGAADPGDPAYIYNTNAEAGYSGRLRELIDGLAQPRTFAAVAGLESNVGLDSFSASSVGWLAQQRQVATDLSDQRTALRERAASALSGAVGINIDQEMADMLELERSYQASSRLFAVADSMLQTLLDTVR